VQGSFGRNLLWLVAILGAVGLLLYLFVFDTWVVPADDPAALVALQPLLTAEDRILTRRGSIPKNAQLARCLVPDGSGKYVIGRAFGSGGGGEQIEVNNERVAVGGKLIASRHACGVVSVVHPVSGDLVPLNCSVEDNGSSVYSVLLHPEFREGQRLSKLEAGKLYLVSDNRHFHYDSRDFGPVDASTCEHVVFRLWGSSYSDDSHRFNILW